MLGYTTYYYSGDVSSLNSMKNNAGSIDAIAAAVHLTDSTGGITGPVPTEQIAFAASAGIRAYALVGNNFSGSIAKILLESSIYRQRMILNLLSLLRNNGYKGVCMDFEGMYATNRDQYSSFLREISASIKPLGYDLIVCVAAKTYDNPSNSWSGAFDYPAIGQVADRVAVMTYDEHYMGGVPGPVASIGWVTRVADYTVSVIPPEKVLLGVAAYGYDWGSGGCKAYSMNGCLNLASQYGAVIQWDAVSQSPWFRYTDAAGAGHEVWFESAQSIRFKLDLVNVRNICGIALWRLGLENAAFWSTLGDLY
ncbi:MAG TPA: glycoside hydrolase family 18 [Clostridiales bacterium]|nr:glycoside hydrolase family 18 [Clostridiales bacterium]